MPFRLFSRTETLINEYLAAAKVMAQFFSNLAGTIAVGLFGSLARNQRPGDIDLIVFNDLIYSRLRPSKNKYPFHLEKPDNLRALNLAPADLPIMQILTDRYLRRGITFDVHIMPANPTEELLTQLSADPKFLSNLQHDILFWHKEANAFAKDEGKLSLLLKTARLPSRCSIEVISGHDHAGEGSALIIENNGLAIGLDCGLNPTNGHSADLAERIAAAYIRHQVRFLVVSHFHSDHCAALALVLEKLEAQKAPIPIIIATELTASLLKQKLYFSGNKAPGSLGRQLYYQIGTDQVSLLATSHSVPGSAAVLCQGNKTILYTSDFYGINLPETLPDIDLLIVDATNALKEEPRGDTGEQQARDNIERLFTEALGLSTVQAQKNTKKVYVAMFSTQLERASWFYQRVKEYTGLFPQINGVTLLRQLKTYQNWLNRGSGPIPSENDQVVMVTGAWAQGMDTDTESALVRLAQNQDDYSKIQPGDVVILSCRIPLWAPTIVAQIETMCRQIKGLGARVIVDQSAPDLWLGFAEKLKVHEGGHGNLPEIMTVVKKAKPKLVLPFHADFSPRQRLTLACQQIGLAVLLESSLPKFSL